MTYSRYIFSLYQRLIKIRKANLRIRRVIKNHTWLIRKYKNLYRTSRQKYSIGLRRKEKLLNRRIGKDIKNHNWFIRKYVKRVKLERKKQRSSDIVKQMQKLNLNKTPKNNEANNSTATPDLN